MSLTLYMLNFGMYLKSFPMEHKDLPNLEINMMSTDALAIPESRVATVRVKI